MVEPIFLVSLPRSGSTLLQRVLGNSKKIKATSEPWLALPLIYMTKGYGISSEFGSEWQSIAFEDYFKEENDKLNFYNAGRIFLKSLYSSKATEGQLYFLDKTPRYYLILDDLREMFPDGKIIILTRPPLEVINSALKTWGIKNQWNVYNYYIDLYQGVRAISSFLRKDKNVLHISYDSLTNDPKGTAKRLSIYLGVSINFDKKTDLSGLKNDGRLGDPAGIKKYNVISPSSDRLKWVSSFKGFPRLLWVKSYISQISDEDAYLFGFNKKVTYDAISNISIFSKTIPMDVIKMIYGWILCNTGLLSVIKKRKQKRNYIHR